MKLSGGNEKNLANIIVTTSLHPNGQRFPSQPTDIFSVAVGFDDRLVTIP